MNRHFKYAGLLAAAAVLLFVWCGRAGAGPDTKPRLPHAAREAERLYEKQVKALLAEFEAKQRAAFKVHVERLAALQAEHTSAGDLDGALAIRARITELKNPPKSPVEKKKRVKVGLPMDALRGTWMVMFGNGTRHTRKFHGRNQVNKAAHLYRRNGELIIQYPGKGRVIERITLGEDTIIVEHFNPGRTYPKGTPAVLGIGKKLE